MDAPKEKSNKVNGQVYLDYIFLVNPKDEQQLARIYWRLVVDEKTDVKSSMFHKTKRGMIKM